MFNLVWTIISSSIVLIFIALSYNIGIWSQIYVSKFLEKYDDKNKLLKEARENIFSPKKELVLKAVIQSFPFITCYIFVYFLFTYLRNLGVLPQVVQQKSMIAFIILPFFQVIFYGGYLVFCLKQSDIQVSKNGKINYNYPIWLTVLTVLLILFLGYINSIIPTKQIDQYLSYLGIKSVSDYNFSVIFAMSVFFVHSIVIKGVTKYLVFWDRGRYLSLLKENKVYKYHSAIAITGFVMTILFIMGIIILWIKNTNLAEFKFPLGDLLNLITISLMGIVLAAQRWRFIQTYKSYSFKNTKFYYKNVEGKDRIIKDTNV